MIKAIIIDDDRAARTELKQLLRAHYADHIYMAGEADTAGEGLALLMRLHPQLVFLDVELPDTTGIDLLNNVIQPSNETNAKVVIYTAHQRYIIDALRASAFDFLQKPIDPAELHTVVKRAIMPAGIRPIATNTPNMPLDNLLLPENRYVSLRLPDICCFEYNARQRNWTALADTFPDPVRLRKGVNADDLLALAPQFVQVSRSAIVNLHYLQELDNARCRFFPPFDRITHITVSRTYRDQVQQALQQ